MVRNCMSEVSEKKTSEPKAENIAAVIVTYNPDAGLGRRLEVIKTQIDYVIIVDNHSGPESMHSVDKTRVPKFHHIGTSPVRRALIQC